MPILATLFDMRLPLTFSEADCALIADADLRRRARGGAMTRRVVGILGGMGPEATILLQQRLLATRRRRAMTPITCRLLIDMNPQVPSRIAHLIEGTGIDPTPVLVAMARRLEAAGATALAMPCNTAHHYAAAIAAAVSIPLLNMVDLSVAQAAQTAGRRARRWACSPRPRCSKAGVFDAALDRRRA